MTVIPMEVRHTKRESQQTLLLDKGSRDALADYCRLRWPYHTAKMAAREWNLSADEGRGVVAGRSSFTTYDKIKKAGGWPVILAVEAAVVGHGVDQFLARIGASHAQQAERLGALLGGGGPVPAAGHPDPADVDLPSDQRSFSRERRVG